MHEVGRPAARRGVLRNMNVALRCLRPYLLAEEFTPAQRIDLVTPPWRSGLGIPFPSGIAFGHVRSRIRQNSDGHGFRIRCVMPAFGNALLAGEFTPAQRIDLVTPPRRSGSGIPFPPGVAFGHVRSRIRQNSDALLSGSLCDAGVREYTFLFILPGGIRTYRMDCKSS